MSQGRDSLATVEFIEGDAPRECPECGAELTLHHDKAGQHLAIRLDCPNHGPQLMWAPFGDDYQ